MIPDSTIKISPHPGISTPYYIKGTSFVLEFVYEVCSTKYSATNDKIIIRNTVCTVTAVTRLP